MWFPLLKRTKTERLYDSNIEKDLADLPKNVRLSEKGYMVGYYDLTQYNISGIHRFLSKVGDSVMKMKIYRLDIWG